MPWSIPPPALTHTTATLNWRQDPYREETACGDALFVETNRDDGRLHLLLLDVMGHGASAALTARFVGNLLGQSTFVNRNPAELLNRLHDRLQPHWAITYRHVECVAVLIDTSTLTLQTSRAGGLRDLWIGEPGQSWTASVVVGGAFLGIPHESTYTENTLSFPEGAWLLTATDGVTEAGKPGPLFGTQGVQAFLTGLTATVSGAALLNLLWSTLQTHAGPAWPDDDVTALVLTRPSGPKKNLVLSLSSPALVEDSPGGPE
jgi:serine phosphatase RsbU (regulator of sigma subunit)